MNIGQRGPEDRDENVASLTLQSLESSFLSSRHRFSTAPRSREALHTPPPPLINTNSSHGRWLVRDESPPRRPELSGDERRIAGVLHFPEVLVERADVLEVQIDVAPVSRHIPFPESTNGDEHDDEDGRAWTHRRPRSTAYSVRSVGQRGNSRWMMLAERQMGHGDGREARRGTYVLHSEPAVTSLRNQRTDAVNTRTQAHTH
jgi:hypothetical protein